MNTFWQENILILITLFGIIQGIILALVVLFYPERDRNSNSLLATFIITAVIILMAPLLQYIIGWKHVWVFHCIKFITISSLYLYIRSLTAAIKPSRMLKHFSFAVAYIPVAVAYVYYIAEKYEVDYIYEGGQDPYDVIISLSNLLYIAFYFVLYYRAYQDHRKNILANFSYLNRLGLHWIKQLILGFLFTIIVSYAMFAYILSAPEFSTTACLLNMAAITVFLYFVTIRGKISPEVYKLRTLLEQNKTDAAPATQKTLEEKTVSDELKNIADKVVKAMEEHEYYKNENLSIKELGEALEIQPYLVSQAINTVLEKSFYDLVNTYRVEYAKRLLADKSADKYSLVGIGFESGFNSKTTFNTTFKKVTGLTPSAYKRQYS
ncbi:MAG TPA: helix-turn-helix domain-containing protein [Cyclobacteriaceae bacterium]|nr:helix-turn-helix domain-containing protein [Cyclobacteriaceae bacterium]